MATKVCERDDTNKNITYTNVFPHTACTCSGLSKRKSKEDLQSLADETSSCFNAVYTATVHSFHFNIIIRFKL